MDPRRLAEVRAGSKGLARSGGSGYVISRRLVLTACHVVVGVGGAARPPLVVWLGHPLPQERTWHDAR